MAEVDVLLGANGKPSGLNWDALRDAYEKRLDWEVEQGLDPVERRDPSTPKPRTVVSPHPTSGGSRPQYDRRQIVNLYVSAGMTVDDIAANLGAHRQTIRNNLSAAGVTLRDDRQGNPRGRMGRKPVKP